MKIRYLTIVALVLAVPLAFAETVEELFEIAVQNDAGVKSLELSLDRTIISLEQAAIADSLDVSVSTIYGFATSYDFDDSNSLAVSVDPTVSVTLPNPPGTEIGASTILSIVPFDLNSTVFSVSQSIDAINPESTAKRLDELSNRAALVSAKNSLREARRGVKIRLLGDAKTILSFQRRIREAERTVIKQATRIDEEEILGTVNKGSARYLSMMNALKRAERHLMALNRDYGQYLDRFSARTGITPDMFPSEFPAHEIMIPETYGSDTNVSLFLTELSREQTELSLVQVDETSMSARASYDVDDKEIGASVSADFPVFSLSGSAGYDIDERIVSASVGFGWRMNGKRLLELERMKAQNNLASAQLEIEIAYLDSAYALEDLILDVVDLEEAAKAFEENLEYAELYLNETRELFEIGITDEEELEDAEWDLSATRYDGLELAIDRVILALRVEGFTEGIPE